MNPALLGTIAALAWGTHDFVSRFPSRAMGAPHAVFGVTLAGLLWLSLWLAATGTLRFPLLQYLWLPALTGIAFALATIWLFAALAAGPVSVVAPIVGAYPVYAVVFAVVMGARPTLAGWLAMAAVILGVVIVARQGERAADGAKASPREDRRITLRTLILALFAGIGFSCALTAGQHAVVHYGEIEATWLARIFGMAAVTIACLPRPAGGGPRLGRYGRWWILLLAMGLLDALALVAVVTAGRAPNAEIATVASSAFGAVTVLLARVFLKEAVSRSQWAGIAMIFAGVGGLSLSP